VVLLMHSLGTSLEMWDPQMPSLKRRFRVVRFDARGHGKSSVPATPASVEELGLDALAILDKLGVHSARIVGLSMGGQVGFWLAQNAPERVSHLVVANSAPKIGTAEIWNERIEQVTKGGMESVIEATMKRWLKQETRDADGEALHRLKAMVLATNPKGYAACCAVVRDADLRPRLAEIACPTTIISGSHDSASPAEAGQAAAETIPGAKFVLLDASHASNWEEPQAFARATIAGLVRSTSDSDRYKLGMAMRRQVLGDARIDNIKLTPFNEDFQNFITRYVWGENWTRTGLVPGMRSVLVMGLMIAMGRWDEYRLHVKAAFNNGLDVDFIKEVILVSAIYCGVPAANSAMHHAEEVLKEMGKI
jgi:3-oxoadipate enol-lactonase/4-carboxymuconolactone decarboxylase